MREHNPGQMGGTMRLGKRRTIFKTDNGVLRKQKPLHPLPLWDTSSPPVSPAVLTPPAVFQENSTETWSM